MCNADGCWPATNFDDERLGRGLGHADNDDDAEPGQGQAVVVPPPNVGGGALVRLSAPLHRRSAAAAKQ